MNAIKKRGIAVLNAIKGPRFTPDYNDEVSEEYLEQLRQNVEAKKPEGCKLTPICDPGW